MPKNEHPERESDEVFMGNHTEDPYEEKNAWTKINWTTKRPGNIAYRVSGKRIRPDKNSLAKIFPWFVKKVEIKQVLGEEILASLIPDTTATS